MIINGTLFIRMVPEILSFNFSQKIECGILYISKRNIELNSLKIDRLYLNRIDIPIVDHEYITVDKAVYRS